MNTNSNPNNKQDDSIGALWQRTSNKGLTFYLGKINIDGKETQIVLFKNSKKEPGSKQPDWRIYESKPLNPSAPPAPQAKKAAQAAPARTPAPSSRPAGPRVPVKGPSIPSVKPEAFRQSEPQPEAQQEQPESGYQAQEDNSPL